MSEPTQINVLPFSDQEILEMASKMMPSNTWQKAFIFYNVRHGGHALQMGCRPCFNKVLVYILQIRFAK